MTYNEKGVYFMSNSTKLEIEEISRQLMELKAKDMAKFYEYKGRINALYEKEMELHNKNNLN